MNIDYAVALWNYYFYGNRQGHKSPEQFAQGLCLETIISDVKAAGFGLEMWGKWQGRDLYAPPMRDTLAPLLKGMKISVHTDGARDFSAHEKQINTAAAWGAGTIVLHVPDLAGDSTDGLDIGLAREVVACAAENNITMALENGDKPKLDELDYLIRAVERIEGLKICLDTGHVYKTPHSMRDYLERLGEHIVHLHLEDNLSDPEAALPGSRKPVHYRPGTGCIPEDDWRLLFQRLRENRFSGTGVIEIQPRNPLQLAVHSIEYFNRMCDDK